MIYFKKHMLLALCIGTISGLPLALGASSLTTLLRERGFDLATIGIFGLIAMPYTFKFLWAPLIDSIYIRCISQKLGRRKLQILIIGCLTVFSTVLLGHIGMKGDVTLIAISGLLLTFSSASLDAVIDAARIEMFSDDEQAAGSAMAQSGYRIAMLISSAGTLSISHYFGWEMAYNSMALLQALLLLILILLMDENPYHKPVESWNVYLKRVFLLPIQDLLSTPNVFYIVWFIIFFKMSDALLLSLNTPFLIDLGFDKLEIAYALKTFGYFASIIGALIGGYISIKLGLRQFLVIGLVLQMTSNISYIALYYAGHDMTTLLAVTAIEYICSGISAVALVAYISILCNKEFTAAQYAVFSSLAAFGRTTLSGTSGFLVQSLGWPLFFAFTAIASMPALLLISKIKVSK